MNAIVCPKTWEGLTLGDRLQLSEEAEKRAMNPSLKRNRFDGGSSPVPPPRSQTLMQPQLPQFPGSNLLAALIVDLIKNSLCLILASDK